MSVSYRPVLGPPDRMLNEVPGAIVRLMSCRSAAGETLGIVEGERWLPAATILASGPRTMADLLAAGADAIAALRDGGRGGADRRRRADPLDDADLLAPVPRPGKVVAIGRNYREHADEEGVEPPAAPLIFAKWPSSVVGHGAEIRWDAGAHRTGRLRGGARGRHRSRRRAGSPSPTPSTTSSATPASTTSPPATSSSATASGSAASRSTRSARWARSSSPPTRSATPRDLAIRCTVGDDVLQEARTSQMYFWVAEIVSYCSMAFTLEPGDVIATGTPSGVGVFRKPPRYLADGDRVTVEIERIGVLENVCRVERRRERRRDRRGRRGTASASSSRAPSAASAPGRSASCVREGVPVVAFDLGRDPRRIELIVEPDELARVDFVAGRHHRSRDRRTRPRRARHHQRHPPRRAAGAVLPCRSAARCPGQRRPGRSTSSRPSSVEATGWRPVVYTGSIGMFSPSDVDPVTRPARGGRGRPSGQPLRRLQARQRGHGAHLLGRLGRPERRPAADDGLRRRPRPGHDEHARPSRSRPPCSASRSRSAFGGRTLFQYAEDVAHDADPREPKRSRRARGSTTSGGSQVALDDWVAAIEAAVPEAAGLITVAPDRAAVPGRHRPRLGWPSSATCR